MSWLDHFTSLGSQWTTVTGGTGTVTQTDGYARTYRPDLSSYAYMYNTTHVFNKNKSWLFMVCGNQSENNVNGRLAAFWDTAAPGTVVPFSTYATQFVIECMFNQGAGVIYPVIRYLASDGSTIRTWDGSAWSTGAPLPIRGAQDDYFIWGIENDAVNARWRGMVFHRRVASGADFDMGLRLFQLTDWVNWSATKTIANTVYLISGFPINNIVGLLTNKVEWMRYEDGPRVEAWCNGKTESGTNYDIRQYHSYGEHFIPHDRTTVTLSASGGGAWEDFFVKDPSVLLWDNKYYLFYSANSSAPGEDYQIGVAYSSSIDGPWTRYASNPIIAMGGTHHEVCNFPVVIADMREPDAMRRFKMIYSGIDLTPMKFYHHLATAPHPLGPWTKQGEILGLAPGTAGSFDEDGSNNGCLIWVKNHWEWWHAGGKTNANSIIEYLPGRAISKDKDLLTLQKDGVGARLSFVDASEALTADLTGNTVTVADTTNFVADGGVCIDDDSNGARWNQSKIRKVVSSTQLELYHGITGYASATPSYIIQTDSYRSFQYRVIERRGGTWYFWGTVFKAFAAIASIAGGGEPSALWKHTGEEPVSATPVMDQLTWPNAFMTNFGHDAHAENICFVTYPLHRFPPRRPVRFSGGRGIG